MLVVGERDACWLLPMLVFVLTVVEADALIFMFDFMGA